MRAQIQPMPARLSRPRQGLGAVGAVAWLLTAAGLISTHLLIGGTRPIFALPGYLGIAVACLVAAFASPVGQFKWKKECFISLFAFTAYLAGRAILSPVAYLAFNDLALLVACFAIYVLTGAAFPLQPWRIALVWVLLAIAVLDVGLGAVQFRDWNDFMLFGFSRPTNYVWRASGLFICPNHLAGYLEVVGVMAASLAIWSRMSLALKLLAGYLAAVCVVGVGLTASRGGVLSTAGAFMLLLIISLWIAFGTFRGKFFRVFAVTVVILGLLTGAGYHLLMRSTAITSRLSGLIEKTNNRYQMWEAGFQQFFLNPVWGTGAGTYVYYGRQFRPPKQGYGEDPIHAHNDYVELLAGYGLVGLALFALALATHAATGLRTIAWLVRHRLAENGERTSNPLALSVGAICGLAAIALHSNVDFNMHIPANAMVVAFLLGILGNPGVTKLQKREVKFQPWPLASRGLLLALGLTACALFAPRIRGEYYAEKARVALRDEKFIEAIQFARKGLESQKHNPELYHHLGEARLYWASKMTNPLMARAFYVAAARSLEQGLALFPQDLWRLISLGQAYDSVGSFDQAQIVYERIVTLDPHNGQVYAFLGLHYERQGNIPAARDAYRKSIETGLGVELAHKRIEILDRQQQKSQ